MMIIDMDAELQRLICISMDKMTTSSSNRLREGKSLESKARKCGGLNLRKALLVAHVLQDMRNAYISDDYAKLLNTIRPDLKHCENNKDEFLSNNKHYDNINMEHLTKNENSAIISDEWLSGSLERPTRKDLSPTSMEIDTPLVKPQECVLNNDTTMSRTCHYTYPIPVSVNTEYVLSPRPTEHEEIVELNSNFSDDLDANTPAVCQQVEVISTCEDIETTDIEVVKSEVKTEDDIHYVRNHKPNSETCITNGINSLDISMECVTDGIKPSVTEKDTICFAKSTKKSKCPLPRKKRPLPKEFTVDNETSVKECNAKRSRTEITSSTEDVTQSTACTTSTACFLHNSTTTTTQSCDTTVASLSNTNFINSTSVTTSVTSQISSTSSTSTSTTDLTTATAKVAVQLNRNPSPSKYQSLWSTWSLPVTCRSKICDMVAEQEIAKLRSNASNLRSAHLPVIAC